MNTAAGIDGEKLNVYGESHTSSTKDVEESSNVSSAIVIDAKAERALVWKLDLILLPLFTIICEYFVTLIARLIYHCNL